jgi:hypothetical protein
MLEQILNALIPVAATGLVTLVAFLVRSLDKWVRANVGIREYSILSAIATVAVQSVEQQYFESESPTKKLLAVKAVNSFLDERKIKINVLSIDNAVEAAVLREFGTK